MNTIKKSRLFKVISAFFALLFLFMLFANALISYIFINQNLIYADDQQIQKKVYSYLHEKTAGDLMNYLNFSEKKFANNIDNKNYFETELDIMKSKYSKDKSNVSFTLYDDYGNIILNNYLVTEPEIDNYFSFKSDYNFIINENIVNFNSISSDAFTSQGIIFNNPSDTKDSVPNEQSENIQSVKYKHKQVSGEDLPADNLSKLNYYYSDEYDNNIYHHCLSLMDSFPYNISEMSFYQDEYTYDENNNIISKTKQNDDDNEIKRINTSITLEKTNADISYSYTGIFNIKEFKKRIVLSYVLLNNSNNSAINLNYSQKDTIKLTLISNVNSQPTQKDIYYYTLILINFISAYFDKIIFSSIVYSVFFLLSLIYIIWSAGYIPNKEKPVAKGLHAIPFDLSIIIAVIFSLAIIYLFWNLDIYGAFSVLPISFIWIIFFYSLIVRIKSKTTINNTLLVKTILLIKKLYNSIEKSNNTLLKIILSVGIYLFLSAIEVIFITLVTLQIELGILLTFIKIITAAILGFIVFQLSILQNSAKHISMGKLDYNIDNAFLIGPFKKHAENLNNIKNAVNSAIDEKIKSESLKTELITNVSHDLKTPLTSIVNYVDLLKKEEISSEKANEYISVIDRQSQRLKKLTFDIVEASKAATGNIEVNLEHTCLNVLLLQTNGEYIEKLNEKNLTLIQNIPEENIYIMSDGRLLWRILDNIMNNVCKYSLPATRVYLELKTIDDKAIISLKNISKNALNIPVDNLTERFVRGDTSRNTEGSGLGLSIAKSFTELNSGTLDILVDGDLFKIILTFPLA